MFSPVQAVTAIVRGAPPGVLAGMVATTTMFSATPFLIPEVADRLGLGDGRAGLLSVVQVALFAVANVTLHRVLPASGQLFRVSAVAFVAGNAVSVVAPGFLLLLVARGATGFAAGALTWLAWAAAMRSDRGVATMSALGPVTALVAAPVLSLLAEAGGDRLLWAALGLVGVPALLLPPGSFAGAGAPGEHSRSRSNRVLLAGLFLLTLSAASLFVYQRVLAVDGLGLSPLVASLGFSCNAAAGLAGARLAGRHRRPGLWLASAGPAAWVSVVGGTPLWFFVGMAWWGFAFWMGVPGVLRMLAARSLQPGERAGDAQGVMAFGRSVGPGLGGLLIDAGDATGLAAASGAGLVAAGLVVVGVQEGRATLPVTDPRTVRD